MKHFFWITILLVTSIFLSGCSLLSKKEKAGLQVQITDNTPASIYLNDTYLEKTPLINKDLNPGEYTLKIQPDDPTLIAYETKITLRSGLLSVVTWQLGTRPEFSGGVIYEMEPTNSKNKSELSFITIPDGAIVSLSGEEKMFAPVIIPEIEPGHVEFEVSLPSYVIQKHVINALPGHKMLITVKLAKETNPTQTPQASTPPNANAEASLSATESASASGSAVASDSANTTRQQQAGYTKVKINPTNFFVEGQEVLRVRDLPNAAGTEVGLAKVGSTYQYLGNTQNNWFNIQLEGTSGWVTATYAQLVE